MQRQLAACDCTAVFWILVRGNFLRKFPKKFCDFMESIDS
jgi:hypothetical protein